MDPYASHLIVRLNRAGVSILDAFTWSEGDDPTCAECGQAFTRKTQNRAYQHFIDKHLKGKWW